MVVGCLCEAAAASGTHRALSGRRRPPAGVGDSARTPSGLAEGMDRQRYLVDPASNHMLVSKIKPCMSKYKPRTRRDCGRLIKSVMTPLGPDSPVDNVR